MFDFCFIGLLYILNLLRECHFLLSFLLIRIDIFYNDGLSLGWGMDLLFPNRFMKLEIIICELSFPFEIFYTLRLRLN